MQTDCLMLKSRLALAGGSVPDSIASAEQALAWARSERSPDPINDRYRVAAAYLLLGDARNRARDTEGAKAVWSAGLAQLPQGVAERPQDTNVHAELLRRLGRGAEARPLAARLEALGYRSAS
jgi:hypothetical protein